MTSVALFGVGSALCGLAWSAESLIFFRVLQGIGGGMIMPVGMSVLAQTAGPHRVGRVMSVIGVPMLLGPILGPVIGGLIVDTWSWRWIFYVNVPIAIVSLVLARRLLHADAGRRTPGSSTGSACCCSPPASPASCSGSRRPRRTAASPTPIAWVPIVAGAVLVAAFVRARGARAAAADRRAAVQGDRRSAPPRRRRSCSPRSLFGAMIILPLYYQVGPRRVRADRRPADGAAGPRRGARRCRSPASSPTGWAAAASRSSAS